VSTRHFKRDGGGLATRATLAELARNGSPRLRRPGNFLIREGGVEGAFGGDVDYAQLVKLYGSTSETANGRYSPAECIGARKQRIDGNPDPKHVSTSFAERSNLSVRMHTRRFTRLTNGFSKKVENHAHSVALFALYYNFVRIHKTLRTTPAMAAGVTKRLWEMTDIVDMLEAWEAAE
jgi:hypothetical protein